LAPLRRAFFFARNDRIGAQLTLVVRRSCLTRFGARLPRSGGAFLVLGQERWPAFPVVAGELSTSGDVMVVLVGVSRAVAAIAFGFGFANAIIDHPTGFSD
jgi:hypothetical protein